MGFLMKWKTPFQHAHNLILKMPKPAAQLLQPAVQPPQPAVQPPQPAAQPPQPAHHLFLVSASKESIYMAYLCGVFMWRTSDVPYKVFFGGVHLPFRYSPVLNFLNTKSCLLRTPPF